MDANMSGRADVMFLSEDQRVAFYGAMLAIAAADGVFGEDELDLIFETVETDSLSERSRQMLWDYLVDTPRLADCLACFSASDDRVRCALMRRLTETALADQILAVGEEEALLQARQALHINQQQMQAIERHICEVGWVRARARHGKKAATLLKHGPSVFVALGLLTIALYVSSTVEGVNPIGTLLKLVRQGFGLAVALGAGAAIAIGAAVFLTGRWWDSRSQRRRTRSAGERRQRTHLAVRNLREALDYLATKTPQRAPVEGPGAGGEDTCGAFAERFRMLQQMLARRQTTTPTVSSFPGSVPRISPL
jgi:uncharacterized tellurite resistance protein B-like protein